MNKKIVFLTFCSVACLFSCTNKKDVNEDIKNIYNNIKYYVFRNSTNIW